MGFRFFRRIRIAPGISINLSKSGASLSMGPRGAKFTVGPRGTRTTVGIPGTGLYYTQTASAGRTTEKSVARVANDAQASSAPPRTAQDSLTLGFFQKLITPASEKDFVDGMREVVSGNHDATFLTFKKALHLADASYMAGFLSITDGRLEEAEYCLREALKNTKDLGKYFTKYGVSAQITISITDVLRADIEPNERGIYLGLVEVYQHTGKLSEAITCLKWLWVHNSADLVVKTSLVELYMETRADDKATCDEVVQLTMGIDNESALHAALLLYRAKALRHLGLNDAARELLTKTIAGSKGYMPELRQALRYERALVYEGLGQKARARKEFELLYAETPKYEDVAERLGVTPAANQQ